MPWGNVTNPNSDKELELAIMYNASMPYQEENQCFAWLHFMTPQP